LSSDIIPEETVVGRHESGIILQEGLNTSTSRSNCSECKRNSHCFVTVDKETREAEINKTCTNETCKCKCRTHYACKICGMLHPYGINSCTKLDLTPKPNKKSDEKINRINAEWKEFQAQKQQNMPKIKHD